MKKCISLLATWFGLGLLPRAPGTWGTLGAIPLLIGLHRLGPMVYMLGTLFLVPFAMFIAHLYEKHQNLHDAREIVIDEVAGFFITMTWIPITTQSLFIGFVLFRILDIWKPQPIRALDRKIGGGVGVVIDDVAAGLMANVVLQILYTQTQLLGEQYLLIGS